MRQNERKVALLYDSFTTAVFPLVRVLRASPKQTNLGNGGAWFG